MKLNTIMAGIAVLALAAFAAGCSPTTGPTATGHPTAIFAAPQDGDTVSAPVEVEMTATNVEIAEAGEVVPGEGHFHIMVNVPCLEEGEVIPSDDDHLHYGDGSTTDALDLEPGDHTLCLQLGDGEHAAMGGADEIAVTVE